MWKLNRDKCVSCEECVKCCPLQSLEMVDGYPRMKEDAECILCSTCADTCPEQAIELTMDSPAPECASKFSTSTGSALEPPRDITV